jgi:ribosome-associated translation inhibitor RaiA
MKRTIAAILIIGYYLEIRAQSNCVDCPNDKNISTNPMDAENCEVGDAFPNKTNQFLNTFNVGKYTAVPSGTFTFDPIPLNPLAGWQINAPLSMLSPFYQGYLDKPGGSTIADFDYHWDDGWELVWLNTGYFPNGDVYHDPGLNNNPMITTALGLHHDQVPYIIMYNRYNAKMRLLFNVFTDLGTYSDVKLDIGYLNTTNVSGVFRHVKGYDTPLDQQTSTSSFSTNFENFNNDQKWFMSDVQLGYDACVCDYFSQFDFNLWGITSYNVNLYGRSITTTLPLKDPSTGKPVYSDFLNMNTIDMSSEGGGSLIYKSLDGMLNEYDKELKEYKDRLNDYNSIGNTALREIMKIGKAGLNAGLKGLVPEYILKDLSVNAVRVVASTFDKKHYFYGETWERQNPSDPNSPYVLKNLQATKAMTDDAKKYSQELSKTLKGGLGSMSDALFTSFYTDPTKPVKPNMPTASFTEMRITGDITAQHQIVIGNLYNPGSFKFGGSFNPSAYPIYNEPVGLFALLKTPEFSVFNSYTTTAQTSYDRKGETEIYIKLKSPLKYRFNHAVDFDFERTQLYGQIQVEYKTASEGGTYIYKTGNLKMLHTIPNPTDNSLLITLTSDWIPIDLLGEYLSSIRWTQPDWISLWHSNSPPTREKITFKIMADMYFESLGFGGTEKNTTQVFTYLLYDKDKNIDFIQEKGEYLSYKNQIAKYEPGTLVLENETIEWHDYFVSDLVGNTIYVNAEQIELKGNISVESGYDVVLRAFWDIKSEPTSEIGPGITLEIKRDFYNFPPTNEVTNAELEAFCKTTSTKEYKSNELSEPMREEMEEQIRRKIQKQKSSFEFKVSPNPNNGNFKVSYDLKDEYGSISVMNIQSQKVFESNLTSEANTMDLNLSHLAKGLYLIELTSGDRKSTQKIVIQ